MDTERAEKREELKDELITLGRRLRTEEQAVGVLLGKYDALCLNAIDDDSIAQEATDLQAHVARSRAKIHGIELLIGQKEKAKAVLDKAIFAEFERERQEADRAARYERWQGLAVEGGTAKKEMESLTKELTAAQDAIDEQADVIQRRRDDLSALLEAKPTPADFPTQAALAKWNARHKAVENAVTEAFNEMRRRTDNRSDIAARQLAARIRFEQLASQERLQRLPGFELATAS